MKNIPIQDFMDEHRACRAGRRWVAEMGFATCRETFEALCNGKAGEDSYNWAVWFATRPGVLSGSELVGLAAWCTRRVAHLLTDDRSIKALELAERFAAGEWIFTDEIQMAADAAWAAYAVDAVDEADAAWAARAVWAATDAAADPDAECRAQLEHLLEIVKFEEAEAAE